MSIGLKILLDLIEFLLYHIYRINEYVYTKSIGIDDKYYIYYFENHGFNEYNIIGRISL